MITNFLGLSQRYLFVILVAAIPKCRLFLEKCFSLRRWWEEKIKECCPKRILKNGIATDCCHSLAPSICHTASYSSRHGDLLGRLTQRGSIILRGEPNPI